MLRKADTLKGYKLHSLDGEIGEVTEFYFDDRYWTVRYLVANTVKWLPGRPVLISPYALGAVNKEERTISVDLTEKQVKESPPFDSDMPVSLQFEKAYHDYYGWPLYWTGTDSWGSHPYLVRDREQGKQFGGSEETWDHNLRSTKKVSGYFIQATDGEIGHVDDFMIDDESWGIRYLVIETRNWWPGKHVLISPKWIERVSWGESKVFINLSLEAIKHSPEYFAESTPTRGYEAELHKHYKRQGYWIGELGGKQQFY